MNHTAHAIVLFATAMVLARPLLSDELIGAFTSGQDIGQLKKAGEHRFDSATKSYEISASGANMWSKRDDLHFVWKKVEGDLSLAATIEWITAGKDPHRKACLLIRQSLDHDAAYADAVIHGDGLCSLQYRETQGDDTHEIQSAVSGPKRLRIEKRGDYVSMSIGDLDKLQPAGGTFRIQFEKAFYVGLGVCSHNQDAFETARFSNIVIEALSAPEKSDRFRSTLEVIQVRSTDRRVVYHTSDHIEAPNWYGDGKALIFNSNGGLFRIPVEGGNPTKIPTGELRRLNNDHGLSPNQKQIVMSDQTRPGGSRLFLMPIEGGTPRLVTENAPSYWHGWSPDGKTLAYCAERSGNYDIYTIPVEGGEETRLTTAEGLDDGPDYSPDGSKIYFNSVRTGRMQIWSMNPDGSDQYQLTDDDWNNWFPHPSPDGRWLVMISYDKGVSGHPANKDVALRLMSLEDGKIRTIAKLYGGQGTINVPSWSPDSQRFAFVSYQPE